MRSALTRSMRIAGLGLASLALAAAASARPQALRPDLVEASVSNPPRSIAGGERFKVTDLVKNRGRAAARTSATAFYLVKGPKRTAAGFRKVPRLKVGKADSGSSIVFVPPDAAVGTYTLLVCADVRHVVRESSEANNCRFAARKFQITKPKPPPI
jgi:subtilase family serine protease